jgi:hypothetical protein
MPHAIDLTGKCALVTGAAGGITGAAQEIDCGWTAS